jgi:peptide/nickel transport system permease protein
MKALARRLLRLAFVLWLVSLATFFMLELVPGDPATQVLGTSGTPQQYAAVRARLGLDKPVLERYFDWLGGALRGDLGRSLVPPVQDVGGAIRERLPVTLQIAVMGLALALVTAVPLALWSAYQVGRRVDRVSNWIAFSCVSIPSFLSGLLLVWLFVFHPGTARTAVGILGGLAAVRLLVRAWRVARRPDQGGDVVRAGAWALGCSLAVAALVVWWPHFPRQDFVRLTSGDGLRENLRSAFLPTLTIAMTEIAVFFRLLRSDLVTTLQSDFILAAKAKGMPTWRILWRDALRPSSFSLVTLAGVSLGRLIGGTVIVEVLFNLPGMGRLVVDSIGAKDYTMVQGTVLVIATFYVLINAVVDVSYAVLDPRVRRGS